MATPLTAAHRRWRLQIFAATWLTYVGFYFCRKPFSASKSSLGDSQGWDATTLGNLWACYLIAYAIGQFVASGLGTKLGPRRSVLLGMTVSITATLAMGFAPSAPVMAGLLAMNGLAQATGWSGTVGTMAGWFHKHERGRVMGMWSTNFTVGSILSGVVMAWVLGMREVWIDVDWLVAIRVEEPAPWRWCFYGGALVLMLVWIQFFLFQRNRPEDVGLPPIDDPVTAEDESRTPDPPGLGLSRAAWINMLLVGGFYFFSKFVRYAVWSWSAYFLAKNFGKSEAAANAYAIAFDLCGIPGVYLAGWISDRYLGSRRAGISLAMMVGMTATTLLLMLFGDVSVTLFVILLGAVGLTLYGPDALLTGAGAIDIGGRKSATFAAAVISGFGSMGPVVQSLLIPLVYDQQAAQEAGDLGPVFVLLFGSAAIATLFCAILVWRNRKGQGV